MTWPQLIATLAALAILLSTGEGRHFSLCAAFFSICCLLPMTLPDANLMGAGWYIALAGMELAFAISCSAIRTEASSVAGAISLAAACFMMACAADYVFFSGSFLWEAQPAITKAGELAQVVTLITFSRPGCLAVLRFRNARNRKEPRWMARSLNT